MTDVADTLAERGARYGAFRDHAAIAQGLQEVLWETRNWYALAPDVRQMLVVITDKMARILNGDQNYRDNYHDIQGYAKLVEDRLLEEEETKKGQLFDDKANDADHECIATSRVQVPTLKELEEQGLISHKKANDIDPEQPPAEIISGDRYNTVEPVNGDWEAVGNYRG